MHVSRLHRHARDHRGRTRSARLHRRDRPRHPARARDHCGGHDGLRARLARRRASSPRRTPRQAPRARLVEREDLVEQRDLEDASDLGAWHDELDPTVCSRSPLHAPRSTPSDVESTNVVSERSTRCRRHRRRSRREALAKLGRRVEIRVAMDDEHRTPAGRAPPRSEIRPRTPGSADVSSMVDAGFPFRRQSKPSRIRRTRSPHMLSARVSTYELELDDTGAPGVDASLSGEPRPDERARSSRSGWDASPRRPRRGRLQPCRLHRQRRTPRPLQDRQAPRAGSLVLVLDPDAPVARRSRSSA